MLSILAVWAACGCATDAAAPPRSGPGLEELRALLAQELASDSHFDSFAMSSDPEAHRLAAVFRPELAHVQKLNCRVAAENAVDCLIGLVLRFPGLQANETRVVWERRFAVTLQGWTLVHEARARP